MMFRALSLLALVSLALATPNIPRTLLVARQLTGSSSADSCSDTCLDVSDVLQSCTTADTCCPDSVISEVETCVNCGVASGIETEADGQDILDQYQQACSSVGVDTGPLTVDTASGAASATPTVSASTASGAASVTRAGASSAVFTPVTALSSIEASASAEGTSAAASASRTASAASSSATSSDGGSGVNIPGTAGSGAAGLGAPASLALTAVVGVAAVFLA